MTIGYAPHCDSPMPLDKSPARVQQMFGEIAGRYDLLNRLLSLGIDRSWRRRTVKLVPPEGDGPILDVCTGTADLALAYWRAGRGQAPVVGTDFCPPMLAIGREKCRRAEGIRHTPCAELRHGRYGHRVARTRSARITLLEADTLRLPFPDDTFQIVCVAFGLRNLSDTDAGLREMARVCRPGGRVAVLEFSTPSRLAAGGPLRLVLPPRPAPHRPGTGSKHARQLTITFRRASAASPRARPWPSGCGRPG